jgi:hypothetical protein
MKKGSLWVLFVVVVFGLMLNITACQKKESTTTESTTSTTTESTAPEAMPATTGGVAPAAPAPAGSAQ